MIKKIFLNKYAILIFFFLLWILIFDDNSFYNQRKLRGEYENLQNTKVFYQEQIEQNQKQLKELKSEESLEKYAREQYLMKKKDEVIFLIEVDSTK
jgi:cell division protein FtsB|tara:strand:+ start:343 stop:630 length:288 start_codon:yes stop_codon:yes gene_type:complete